MNLDIEIERIKKKELKVYCKIESVFFKSYKSEQIKRWDRHVWERFCLSGLRWLWVSSQDKQNLVKHGLVPRNKPFFLRVYLIKIRELIMFFI